MLLCCVLCCSIDATCYSYVHFGVGQEGEEDNFCSEERDHQLCMIVCFCRKDFLLSWLLFFCLLSPPHRRSGYCCVVTNSTALTLIVIRDRADAKICSNEERFTTFPASSPPPTWNDKLSIQAHKTLSTARQNTTSNESVKNRDRFVSLCE